MPKIRTVFHPDTVHEVDEHEAAQLGREGLLLPLDEPQPEPAAEPAAKTPVPATAVPAAPKETGPDGGKQAQ